MSKHAVSPNDPEIVRLRELKTKYDFDEWQEGYIEGVGFAKNCDDWRYLVFLNSQRHRGQKWSLQEFFVLIDAKGLDADCIFGDDHDHTDDYLNGLVDGALEVYDAVVATP